jgi:DNA adenine methylase
MKNHSQGLIVKSPLNYPGNKARILNDLIYYFPKNIDVFVDVFGGSGIVGLNSFSNSIIYNDISLPLINLLKYFRNNTFEFVLGETLNNITKYGLTNTYLKGRIYEIKKNEGLSLHNRVGYEKVRSDYNLDTKRNDLLFLLVIYGFNHYLRFNKKGLFNVPIGKVDLYPDLVSKIKMFVEALKARKISFFNTDFNNEDLFKKLDKDDFVYFDPPYSITIAPYNQYWSKDQDDKLFKLFETLTNRSIKCAMSNVIHSNGKTNTELVEWSNKFKVFSINRKYLNSNYRKKNLSETKEVLILNY